MTTFQVCAFFMCPSGEDVLKSIGLFHSFKSRPGITQ